MKWSNQNLPSIITTNSLRSTSIRTLLLETSIYWMLKPTVHIFGDIFRIYFSYKYFNNIFQSFIKSTSRFIGYKMTWYCFLFRFKCTLLNFYGTWPFYRNSLVAFSNNSNKNYRFQNCLCKQQDKFRIRTLLSISTVQLCSSQMCNAHFIVLKKCPCARSILRWSFAILLRDPLFCKVDYLYSYDRFFSQVIFMLVVFSLSSEELGVNLKI